MLDDNSGGTTIHGILVIIAAIIGVIGYVVRSHYNHREIKKQEQLTHTYTRTLPISISKYYAKLLLLIFYLHLINVV